MSRTIASSVPSVLERCAPVRFATRSLPRFGWSSTRAEAEGSQRGTEGGAEAATIGWRDVLSDAGEPSSLDALLATHSAARCFVFGEQHHQPKVLLAQLSLLDALSRRDAGADRLALLGPDEVTAARRSPPLHLVLEQFNVLQSEMLDRFRASYQVDETASDEASAGERLIEAYDADGSELEHYMPLLLLARSRGVKLHGGFPPRRWARTVSKEGIDAARTQAADEGFPQFDRWDDLRTSPEHSAYIRSLIRGEPPLVEPLGPDQPLKGLPAAQASKDACMAFVIDQLLADPSATVLAITGSGHCEFAFGVVERVRSVERAQQCVIVAAAEDQPVWRGERWGDELEGVDGRAVADAIFVYDAVDM